MEIPNFQEERRLYEKGYKGIVGLDEAGRGPLAGPVLAVAVFIKPKTKNQKSKIYTEVKDSKKLSPKKRERIFRALKKDQAVEWGIGRASARIIEKINILEATKLAMKRAVINLNNKMNRKSKVELVPNPRDRVDWGQKEKRMRVGKEELKNNFLFDFLIIDGNFGIDLDIPQKSIVKADEKVFSCVLASIIAKVFRDKAMLRYHKKYPCYAFNRHKGYPTKLHRRMLRKYGLSKIHRKTFRLC